MPTFALIWQLLLITTLLREVSNTPKLLLLSKAKFSRHSKRAQRPSPLPFCSNSWSIRRLRSCSCRPLSDKPSAPFRDSFCSFGHCWTSLNLETTIKQSLWQSNLSAFFATSQIFHSKLRLTAWFSFTTACTLTLASSLSHSPNWSIWLLKTTPLILLPKRQRQLSRTLPHGIWRETKGANFIKPLEELLTQKICRVLLSAWSTQTFVFMKRRMVTSQLFRTMPGDALSWQSRPSMWLISLSWRTSLRPSNWSKSNLKFSVYSICSPRQALKSSRPNWVDSRI